MKIDESSISIESMRKTNVHQIQAVWLLVGLQTREYYLIVGQSSSYQICDTRPREGSCRVLPERIRLCQESKYFTMTGGTARYSYHHEAISKLAWIEFYECRR